MKVRVIWARPTDFHLYDIKRAELYKEPPLAGHAKKKLIDKINNLEGPSWS